MLTSSFSINRVCTSLFGLINDEVSLLIVYITCFIIFISFVFSLSLNSLKHTLILLFMLVACVIAFTSTNMFIIYIFYESSLIPILYIIIKWGSYPERRVSSIMLLVYTSIFTFPFVYILFNVLRVNNSFSFLIFYSYSSLELNSYFVTFLVFITFAVKLPIYGLHFWLPMAHVEAPTFGSMILAGVLLKLGGVGLIRFSCIINLGVIKYVVLSYFLFFIVYVTVVCCVQSDFKRLVAYSSVSHIIAIPIMLLVFNLVSLKGIIILMFIHGIRSPLMFILVGVVYNLTSTRQHFLFRGLLCVRPLLSLIFVLRFFFSVSAPPFPSFVSEVFFSVSALSLRSFSIVFILLFLFFSMFYNLL